ncbi:MAG TPA: iron ABC transporter permease [Bacteroidales bacterium]|nr:iron ABC transporter permease [Bacteroidales bacterium]
MHRAIKMLQQNATNPWVVSVFIVFILVASPVLTLLPALATWGGEVWQHILNHLVPGYVSNTLWLMLGVGFLTFVAGTGTAWLVTMFTFPGSRFFAWALILPLAIPVYINGFAWAGMLSWTSPVYIWLRDTFGINTGPFLFVEILSLEGAVFILAATLYPYVFLISRTWFLKQSMAFSEVSASLGRGPLATFFLVVLPIARPAWVAGVSLVLMEVLNEYGLMRYYSVETFTTGIFTAWFAFSDPNAAMRLSAFLMIFVFALIFLESYQRRSRLYHQFGANFVPYTVGKLTGAKAMASWLVCTIPLLAGFVLPVLMLVFWSISTFDQELGASFWDLLRNSFLLAATSAVIVVFIALMVAIAVRFKPFKLTRFLAKISTLGYSIPGAVVAIGLITAFMWVQTSFSPVVRIVILGTWLSLIYGYSVRFMAVAYNGIDSALSNISSTIDESSRSLGKSYLQTFKLVLLPLLKRPVGVGLLLVFIDVVKELPITLILRPFNFDTLAIRAFELASDERIAEAAPYALVVILVGLLPVMFLHKIVPKG